MCDIYANTDPALYETITRSVRIDGVVTSIRLEQRFWDTLDEIAQSEEQSTPQFINTLYQEVMERRGETGNFTSLLRVVCTVYLDNKAVA